MKTSAGIFILEVFELQFPVAVLLAFLYMTHLMKKYLLGLADTLALFLWASEHVEKEDLQHLATQVSQSTVKIQIQIRS
jgi:hypothetical protein